MKESIKNRNEAYKDIQPKLGLRQQTVFNLIYTYGGLTISEIADKMVLGTNNVSGRIRELEMMCLIKELGSRTNSVTNKKNTIWVTIPEGERKAIREAKIASLSEKAAHLSIDLGEVGSDHSRKVLKAEIKRTDEKLALLI